MEHIKSLNKNKFNKKAKKHRLTSKIGHKFNSFGKGIVKRTDSVGKFGGKILSQQSNAISILLGGLSNPIVLVGIAGVGILILLRK